MIFNLSPDPKRSELTVFFENLKEKTSLYKDHICTTSAFYKKKLADSLVSLNRERDKDLEEAEKNYQRIKEENFGSRDAELIAHHESGLQDVQEYYSNDEYFLTQDHNEMHDYFNKSSLIMLYSLLESELKKLCRSLQKTEGSRITVDHFSNSNYIKGYFNYLDLVIGLPTQPLEHFQTKIQQIQFFRNRIVHNSGELDSTEKGEAKVLYDAIAGTKGKITVETDQISNTGSIKINNSEYILECLGLIEDFFRQLYFLINEKDEAYPILVEHLENFSRHSPEKLNFKIKTHREIKGGVRFEMDIESKNDVSQPEALSMIVSVTSAPDWKVDLRNQTNNHSLANKFENMINKRERAFSHCFFDWLSHKKCLKAVVTITEKI